MLNKHEVQEKAPYTPVPIDKRMDPLEPRMMDGRMNDRMNAVQPARGVTPLRELRRYGGRNGYLYRADLHRAFPPGTRLVTSCWWIEFPRQLNALFMCFGNDVHRNMLVVCGMRVNPVCGPGVSLDIHNFHDRAGRGPAVLDDVLYLRACHRVPFNRGRVVNVVEPDPAQDVVSFHCAWQPAQAVPEQADLFVDERENFLKRRTAAGVFDMLFHWVIQIISKAYP